jgi:lambda family phage portal protein
MMDAPRVDRRAVFGGATGSRLYQDFQAGIYSPDVEIRMAGRVMRARARMLVRDNPHASGFLNELASNVVGPDGILLEAHVSTGDGKKSKTTNQAIERAWLDWGRPQHASVDRRTSWRDLQRLAVRTVAMDGECFFRKIRYFGNPHAFALQFIDADQVDEFYLVGPSPGQHEVRNGVEIDEYGAPIAYHIWSRQISDMGPRQRVRVPAEEIIHLFVQYRGQQTRGVTWFAPALLNLKMLDGYTEAELVAARTAAAKMGFIVNKTPEAIEAYDASGDGETARLSDAAPGSFEELAPGQEMQLFDPKHPSIAFKDFTKAVLRGVARGLNMAYTTLTGDLEAVNYSSIRAGLLSERDWYRTLQRWLIEHCHGDVYDAWLPNALLAGSLAVDSRLSSDYRDVKWRPRGWKWVNPKDDLIAAKLAIDLGLDSRTRLAGEQGRDWEEIIDELAHEIDVSGTAGVDVTGDQTSAGNTKAASPAPRRVRALFRRLVTGEISTKVFYARYERLLRATSDGHPTSTTARPRLRAVATGTGE